MGLNDNPAINHDLIKLILTLNFESFQIQSFFCRFYHFVFFIFTIHGRKSHWVIRMVNIFIHFICLRNFIWLFLHWSVQIWIYFISAWIVFRLILTIIQWVVEWLVDMVDNLFFVRTLWAFFITLGPNLLNFITFLLIITDVFGLFLDFLQYLLAFLFSNGYSGLRIMENFVQILKFLWLLVMGFWGYDGDEAGRSHDKEADHGANLAHNNLYAMISPFLLLFLLFDQLFLDLFGIKWCFVLELLMDI